MFLRLLVVAWLIEVACSQLTASAEETIAPIYRAEATAVQRPNIVVFLSDDHTWRDSSVYGSPDIDTPNMARLAKAGMTFDNAYVASPSCAPSRAAMLTGLYPAKNGAEPNHARPKESLKKLPAYLQELGYEVVSFGKVGHYRQTTEYGFDLARNFNYHDDEAIPEALQWLQDRQSEKPLCLFVGTNWPHVPWPDAIGELQPDQQVVPINHVDNQTTRQRRAHYVAAIKTMDRELGLVYDLALEKLGEKTFFLHTSDHGAQWPFGKWNLYDDGIRTPMIVSWSGQVESGSRSDAMVSWIDILPTLVDVAGGTPLEAIDGTSFLPVLTGRASAHRDLIFTTHSGDGNNNVFPIRCVSAPDGWKYIRNLHPEYRFTSHIITNPGDTGYWSSWVESATASDDARRKVQAYQYREAEELYDVKNDPYEQHNLIEDPTQASRVARLREALDQWMVTTNDPQTVFGKPTLAAKSAAPNVIAILIDDMGWGDLSCFGGNSVQTTNIDRMAVEGIRFNNFYVNSPICSPSRLAFTTGQYPQRWKITSFLNNHADNARRGMSDWLDPTAPSLARQLGNVGYATGHFGKWHLGGQRDVGDAPLISEYGFDRSLTNFEGLGPRVLPLLDQFNGMPPRKYDLGSSKLGKGPIQWADRSTITSVFTQAAIDFVDESQAAGKPFFVNLWLDDVHSPFFPPQTLRQSTDGSKPKLYQAVLKAMDDQLLALFDRIRNDKELREKTLILIASDNGPELGAGQARHLRGSKGMLYEGGVRSPLIVWGPGLISPQSIGTVNRTAILSAIDINLSMYSFTASEMPPGMLADGEDVIETLLGQTTDGRVAPIFWRRPPDRPGTPEQVNPDLAVRDQQWKAMVAYDGTRPQLYDLSVDESETENLAERRPDQMKRLIQAMQAWNMSLPKDAGQALADEAFQASH